MLFLDGRTVLKSRRRFFYYDKSRNGKRHLFANVKSFWHLMRKTFCHLDGANSIKIDLQTCNLWTGRSVSYKSVNWFRLNLPYPNGKKFSTSYIKKNSHLQIDIFFHFDFCHSRRNGFCVKHYLLLCKAEGGLRIF